MGKAIYTKIKIELTNRGLAKIRADRIVDIRTHHDEGRTYNIRFGNMAGRRIYTHLFVRYHLQSGLNE